MTHTPESDLQRIVEAMASPTPTKRRAGRKPHALSLTQPQVRLLLELIRYNIAFEDDEHRRAWNNGYPLREHQVRRDMLRRIEPQIAAMVANDGKTD